MSSLDSFLMGSIAILGGGNYEWLIWLANPLSFIAIICLIFNKKISGKFGLAAIIFALLIFSSNSLLAAESGIRGEIIIIKTGYYLWVGSITILTFGSFLYFKNYIEEKYDD